uniref:Uncharacterized protein n=1 Tax=Anguilla anguilla TaxID=7936 RepID=A0A0E9XIS0_ANGAN
MDHGEGWSPPLTRGALLHLFAVSLPQRYSSRCAV